jgi:hypothetical protein
VSTDTVRKGREYEERCCEWVVEHGWTVVARKVRHASGIELDILARDLTGALVGIECKGGDAPPGLRRSDNIWKVLGQTLALYNWNRAQTSPVDRLRFLVLTCAQPADDEPLAEPLRVAEAEGQLTIVVVMDKP